MSRFWWQKFAIWRSKSSKWVTFCSAVRRCGAGTSSPSLSKPRRGVEGIFFGQETPSTRKGAKLGSRDKVYFKLWRQASKDVIVSCLVNDQCFGARELDITMIMNLRLTRLNWRMTSSFVFALRLGTANVQAGSLLPCFGARNFPLSCGFWSPLRRRSEYNTMISHHWHHASREGNTQTTNRVTQHFLLNNENPREAKGRKALITLTTIT